ncbi:MAG TPA: hypothetical protein VKG05_03630 [Steroidobacteraceae bacterium]|nr:hypothetical protein [Steroidobacteraceae bacterium]
MSLTVLKGTVFLLLLANAIYFLWARGIAGPPDGGELGVTSSLKLVSEAPASREAPGSAPLAAPVPATGPAALSAADAGAAHALSAAGAAATAAPSALLTDVKRCITVGPFSDVAEAAHAAATLRVGGYQPRQRVAEGEIWAGVWVYLPAPATPAAGDQVRAKLKSGGIDDALEMPGPGDKPVISLGLYSEPRRAQARVAQAQALGLNPAIADRKRTGDVYWVDVDLKPTDGLLNPADLQAESGRIVRLEVKACPIPQSPKS